MDPGIRRDDGVVCCADEHLEVALQRAYQWLGDMMANAIIRRNETVSRSARNEAETNSAEHCLIANDGVRLMLAEKFILMIEALIRAQGSPDGSPRVVSASPHIPVTVTVAKPGK